MPKVSIIVTAYNIESYIRQSLDCIVGQSLKDIEIIVVDDGSSDATPDIIREYAARDDRIVPILFEENTIGGVASAANAGLDVASGDYIGFADGDDLYDPSMFERLYQAAEAHEADLAMCQYWLLDESDGQKKEPADAARWAAYRSETPVVLTDGMRRDMLQFVSVPWRKLYRRDLVERLNLRYPVGDFFYEDNPFHWMAVIGGQKMVLVSEKLCEHRVARVGQTMSTVDERLLRIFQHHDIIADWLKREGYLQTFKRDLLRWAAGQLSWVSQRAEGDVRQTLFDVTVPILAQYETADLEAFEEANGSGRTAKMLFALKANDYEAFSRAAGWSAGGAGYPDPSKSSLVSLGMYHLKHSGVRSTAGKTARLVGRKLGLRGEHGPVRNGGSGAQVFDNTDLMVGMIALQKELKLVRAELAELREQIGAQRDPKDDTPV